MQALYKQSHTLRHQNNVVYHIELFYQLVALVDLNEREEQMVAKFLCGLKTTIQDALSLHSI